MSYYKLKKVTVSGSVTKIQEWDVEHVPHSTLSGTGVKSHGEIDSHVDTSNIHFPWQDVDDYVDTVSGTLQTQIDNIDITRSALLMLSSTASGTVSVGSSIPWDNEIYRNNDYFAISPDYKEITIISGGLYRLGYQINWTNVSIEDINISTCVEINNVCLPYSYAHESAAPDDFADNDANFIYPFESDDSFSITIGESSDWWDSDWSYRKQFIIQSDQVVCPGGGAFDNSSNGTTTGSSITFSHTIGSQDNRLLVVGVAIEDSGGSSISASSITYNGQNLTKIADSTANPTGTIGRAELWYILDADLPSTGTYDIVVTLSEDSDGAVAEAVSLYNIKQQAYEATGTNANTGSDTISTDVTTVTNNAVVIDIVECGNNTSFTPNSGQTERQDVGAGSMRGAMSTKTVASAGLTSMGWTNSGANRMAQVAAAFETLTSAHINFPVYITTVDLDGKALANGDDIVFVTTSGTVMDYEIEDFSSGTLHAWVKLPSLYSTEDQSFYVYYGNESADGSHENPTAVWDNDYEAVYHLTNATNDSTSNNRDATAEDTDDIAGHLAGAQDFIPQDEIAIGTWYVSGQALTIQCWASFDDLDQNDPRCVSKATGTSTQDHTWMLGLGGSGEQYIRGRLKTGTSDGSGTTTLIASTDPLSSNTYYLLSLIYDGSNMRLLINGSDIISTAKTGNLRENNWNIALGNHPGNTSTTYTSMDGKLDEVRISSAVRSNEWLQTEYNNQNSPDSFYQTLAEESNYTNIEFLSGKSHLYCELIRLT